MNAEIFFSALAFLVVAALLFFGWRVARRGRQRTARLRAWAESMGAEYNEASPGRLHIGGFDVLCPGPQQAFHAMRHRLLGERDGVLFEAYECILAKHQDLKRVTHLRVVARPVAADVHDVGLRTSSFKKHLLRLPGLASPWPPNVPHASLMLYTDDPSGAPFQPHPEILGLFEDKEPRLLVVRDGVAALVEPGNMEIGSVERQLEGLDNVVHHMRPPPRRQWVRA